MAKRKQRAVSVRDGEKARVELRFDVDLYEQVRQLADEAGISVNQLIQGISRWAMKYAHVGEAEFDHPSDGIETRPQPGCLWFGHNGYETNARDEAGHPVVVPPEYFFSLDFTERHVVRDDWDDAPRKPKGK